MTTDRLSALPAGLLLHVLLHLPDLKTLYAGTLASPRLWAIFHQNSDQVFWSIVNSTSVGLIGPIVLYIKVRAPGSQDDIELLTSADVEAIDRARALPSWSPLPHDEKLFHLVAQAVRIHDLVSWVLRTKLDYLTTLTYYKVENSDPFSHHNHLFPRPALQTIPTPAHLEDPSWVEETRAVRAVWLLAAAWRSGRCSEHDVATGALFPDHERRSIAPTARELRRSILSCSTLQNRDPSTSSLETTTADHTETDSGDLSVLEC
ncbi:hypothetical protein CLAFUW4_12011 [Fulvia fulva]|uniref:F-box domain-containing protein n=1 Tax=Passalora fulva TaxID=5499 RepID=A0A9Q8PF70_PASFU|nr:uncharacterized protein CLAFUR5_11050 [Fulvia fulva]KAK4618328.1 hypothetical protein CLAFUR4_12016 [Fulvia fulva]KAK4619291.1 hypothetical protein CLAFUR0_12027 [Fulvia fulva]UJO21381.1 hypothetical protein CLAFUR5_11050 [Fulvia fulva]WPV18590.1 hypothetical protein CLAFUW4_12011 [Fulvia fulva]WPV32979.1 hypothetical protein CLAFUW7_12018 [Fulvia fulva]